MSAEATQAHSDHPPPPPAPRRTATSHEVLLAMLEISNVAGSGQTLDDMLEKIVEITSRAMKGESCSIYLWNEDHSRLVLRCNLGLEPELIGTAGFEMGRGIPMWVAEERKTVALADGTRDPHYSPLDESLRHQFRAYIASPLMVQEEVLGVMVFRKREVHDFDEDEIMAYETICNQVALVIDKARMEREMIEAEKLAAVAVSLSGVAHFIKNLLTAMKGGEFLLESGLKREDWNMAREGWAVLRRSQIKIREMVENMLNYYRNTDLHPRPLDLNSEILEILQSLEERAMMRNTVLTPDLDMRIDKVEADHNSLQDVMINLITNAIDAIPDQVKGIVKVQTRLDPDSRQVRVAVRDNGQGIPPEVQKKIFTLFYSTKGRSGTGIGPAATRKMILDHHGAIGFTSEPGQGTEFYFTLPLTQPKSD